MSFYLSRNVPVSFDAVSEKIIDLLHAHDYLIAADIDVKGALKQKLDADVSQIRIICTNTPRVGFQIFSSDPKTGVLLPFSIVVHALGRSEVEVSMVDPEFLFQSVNNPEIKKLATEVKTVFSEILGSL